MLKIFDSIYAKDFVGKPKLTTFHSNQIGRQRRSARWLSPAKSTIASFPILLINPVRLCIDHVSKLVRLRMQGFHAAKLVPTLALVHHDERVERPGQPW